MILAHLNGTTISDEPEMPVEMGQLFHGIWAHRMFGGNPCFFGRGQEAPLVGPDQKLFSLRDKDDALIGGVFVTDINIPHRRACVHVSVGQEHYHCGHAVRGLTLAATILGDSFGVECFYTYVLPESPGHRVAMSAGLEEWGRLKGYTLTPSGRSDTLILGGHWPELKLMHQINIAAIKWQGV